MALRLFLLLLSIQNVLSYKEHCGKQKFEPNQIYRRQRRMIVEGEKIVPHSWPWMVGIITTNETGNSTLCSGTLINPGNDPEKSDIVMTAKHCVDPKGGRLRIRAYFGADNLFKQEADNSHKIDVHVKKVSVPDMAELDWVLLKLLSPGKFNDYIQPACLPKEKSASVPKNCYGVGFGDAIEKQDQQKATVQINGKLWQLPLSTLHSDGKNIVAESNTSGGMCTGDSGSPYLCLENNKWVAFGVLSGIKSAPTCWKSKAVYHSTNWIKNFWLNT